MKALRWHARRDIRLEDVPEPSPGPGWVKLEVKYCGICTSDIHEYTSGPIIIPPKGRPHPMTGKEPPIITGHEFSGNIVEVGKGVTGINVGDRVAVRPTMPCYQCYWCRQGRHILCNRLATLGGAADGGFTQYVVARSDCIYRLPDNVTYEMATFCEPLAVVVHAIKRVRITPGDSVAIVGAGPIGLMMIQAARAAGASQVFILATRPKRGEIAKQLGATAVLNPKEVDAGKEVAKRTDRRRADVVFECAGSPTSMAQALELCGRGAKIGAVALAVEPTSFDFGRLMTMEYDIMGCSGYEEDFPTVLSYLADGRFNVEPLITAKIKLDDIIKQGFETLLSERKGEHVKILVSP